MQYKKLGRSALNISRIGFGCMSLKPMQDDIQEIVDEAIDKGINYFDTADLYDKGLNEVSIGKALKAKRTKIIIATKVGNQWKEDGKGWDWNPRKEYIISAVEQSLKRLNTDYIDLYQLHGGTIEDPIDESIEAFEYLQRQGKIRYYGISSIRPNVIKEYVTRSAIVSVMMQYSLLDRRPEEECFKLLVDNNIGVVARGTVAGGLLADKAPQPYLEYNLNQVMEASGAIRSASGEADAAKTAIKFVLGHPAVTAAVVGIRTKKQLYEALEAGDRMPLDPPNLDNLQRAIPVNVYSAHR